jgi:hypothetical protein
VHSPYHGLATRLCLWIFAARIATCPPLHADNIQVGCRSGRWQCQLGCHDCAKRGRNVVIEYRDAEGRFEPERLPALPALAAELVALKVDVIVTAGGTLARAHEMNPFPVLSRDAQVPKWTNARRPILCLVSVFSRGIGARDLTGRKCVRDRPISSCPTTSCLTTKRGDEGRHRHHGVCGLKIRWDCGNLARGGPVGPHCSAVLVNGRRHQLASSVVQLFSETRYLSRREGREACLAGHARSVSTGLRRESEQQHCVDGRGIPVACCTARLAGHRNSTA